jgi:hypothetical protein
MWKAPASFLCGCLAALPLIGCAGNIPISGRAATVPSAAMAQPSPYYAPAARVYAVGSAAPAAVLVSWPSEDSLARDPGLWTAQGFDVVMPELVDLYQMVNDQQAALARLVASAHALANAPIWLVGPDSLIEASLAPPQLRRGGVSGFVVTSVTSERGSCSERLVYEDPGTGAPPKVEVSHSGDCPTGAPAIGRQPSVLPAPQAPRPNQPPLIEASALGSSLPPAAKAQYLAEQIKSAPPS